MDPTVETTLTVNGSTVTRRIPARQHLIDFLREDLGLTGSHTGCEHGACGACTVRVDGKIVRGCLMLAVQADGRRVETIEGLSDSGELDRAAAGVSPPQRAAVRFLHARHADRRAGSRHASSRRHPRADPRAPVGQLLPLHGLPGDRGRDRGVLLRGERKIAADAQRHGGKQIDGTSL